MLARFGEDLDAHVVRRRRRHSPLRTADSCPIVCTQTSSPRRRGIARVWLPSTGVMLTGRRLDCFQCPHCSLIQSRSMSIVADLKSPPRLVAGIGWQALLLLAAATAAGVIFWFAAALPYLLFDEAHLNQYAARRAAILIHIVGGTIGLFAGPVQLWLGLSDRRIDVHRRLGMVYIAAGFISSSAAVYLSTHTDGGWM